MLSRTKSFHKSTPTLSVSELGRAGTVQHTYGRDELAEHYLDLRDQHVALRKQANQAQEQVRLLQVKLNRLIEEKKRHFRLHRTDREISLEEIVYDLEHRMQQQNRQNSLLKQKLHLIQIENQKGRTTTTATTMLRHQQNRRISSAIPTQSRVDSGIRAFRPVSSTVSTTSRKQVSFATTEMSEARTLLAEAKNEILRLECLAEEQQELLESLLERSRKEHPELSSQSTYQLTTTTTTVSSSRATDHSNSRLADHSSAGQDIHSNGNETEFGSMNLDELLNQYQRIMLQTEASSRLGSEVKALIESLHSALQQERQMVAKLSGQLNTASISISELSEKDRQIKALRKENILLQESMQNCMEKCMAIVEGPERKNMTGNGQPSPALTAELVDLKGRLIAAESELEHQAQEYAILSGKHTKLQQLSDNDQLHVQHLEEKIERLTRLVFAQELDSETETTEPETISAQLDQLLNSIVK